MRFLPMMKSATAAAIRITRRPMMIHTQKGIPSLALPSSSGPSETPPITSISSGSEEDSEEDSEGNEFDTTNAEELSDLEFTRIDEDEDEE